ncbi:hypothetical protein FPCIR_8115 [Fusarium pseudocircinatum]|uniref:Uncharacterized protein n=1 Tax=Fusarium pseudocircinatum TaxID=56676 RepID=A0A8H5P109_9HYPO|nr:hypothetical protein FPCIR_8115 [Fusarium pseudocircinatum]
MNITALVFPKSQDSDNGCSRQAPLADEVPEGVMAVLAGDGLYVTALPVPVCIIEQRINTKECENHILIAQIYSRVMFRCGLFESKICEIWRFWGVARTHHLAPQSMT